MAYSKSNPPALFAQSVGQSGGSLWRYVTADDSTAIAVSGYITNAAELGFKANDTLLHIDTTNLQQNWMVVQAKATFGTASGALASTAGEPVGETSIALASAGTGTIVANDIINFAGDETNYLVTTGDADISGGGTLVISPGLVVALTAGVTTPITIRRDTYNLVRFTDVDTDT